MTVVRISAEKNLCILTAKGHAGYSDSGNDIVCAGISTMLYALAGYVSNSGLESHIRMAPGDVEIACTGDTQQVFLMTYIGLAQLAEKFPKNISISAHFPDAIQIDN